MRSFCPIGGRAIPLPTAVSASSFLVSLRWKPPRPPDEGGESTPITLVSANPAKSTAYLCSYAEGENIRSKSPDEALESARDGRLRKTEGTVISQRRITAEGYPALEMQANARGNSIVDARIVVAGKRLDMIMAVTTARQDREPPTIRRMFESFKIVR
jgi:hypothetical protein